MKRSSKSDIRKYLFIIVGISLICLLVLFLKQNRTIKRNFGDIAPVTGKYQEVYYKRSVYKDKTFAKIFADYDSESGDCLTRLLLTGTDVTDTSDPYSGDVPPNIIFDMNMKHYHRCLSNRMLICHLHLIYKQNLCLWQHQMTYNTDRL